MKKLLIVSLGICMLGTACSRDTNRVEENILQQSQEQSAILQTETAGLSETEHMEEPTEVSEERIEQLLKQAETDADQDRYYILEAIDNEEANKRDTDAKLFIKEQYPDYFSSTELLEKGIQYGHYEETIYSEFAGKNNAYGKYYQIGKILSDTADNSYEVTSENTYEMRLYTKAPNQNSTIKIQYPVFYGSKAEEINSLILAKVQDMASLDLSRFPENPKMDVSYQSAVTLQNSKIISVVFWGSTDIEVSQFPTTNLYALSIDLTSLKLITLKDLYTVNAEFEKVFFEKAFFPNNPITSYSEEDFPEMLKIQTSEYNSIGPFSSLDSIRCFLKPEGIVLSMPAVHASGSDHFEAELLYSDIQEYYLPEQIYWK